MTRYCHCGKPTTYAMADRGEWVWLCTNHKEEGK